MAIINYSNPTNPLVEYVVHGNVFSFSVADFPKENYGWLCYIIQRHADEIDKLAYQRGSEDIRNSIKETLKIF